MWILTDETGRIRAASEDTQIVGSEWLEAPEGADMEDIGSYRWEGWKWEYDPVMVTPPLDTIEDKFAKLNARLESMETSLTALAESTDAAMRVINELEPGGDIGAGKGAKTDT